MSLRGARGFYFVIIYFVMETSSIWVQSRIGTRIWWRGENVGTPWTLKKVIPCWKGLGGGREREVGVGAGGPRSLFSHVARCNYKDGGVETRSLLATITYMMWFAKAKNGVFWHMAKHSTSSHIEAQGDLHFFLPWEEDMLSESKLTDTHQFFHITNKNHHWEL